MRGALAEEALAGGTGSGSAHTRSHAPALTPAVNLLTPSLVCY